MVYNGDLVRINGNVIPKVKKYTIGRSKLWQNAERNMNGSVSAYLIGIFPKIKMQVGVLTQEEMAELTALLDQDYFSVTWFDVRIQDTITANYYAGDYEVDLLDKARGLYNPFEVSLVPVEKRRY